MVGSQGISELLRNRNVVWLSMNFLPTLCPSCLTGSSDFASRVFGEMGPQIVHSLLPLYETVDLLVQVGAVRDETELSARLPQLAQGRPKQVVKMSWLSSGPQLAHLLPVPQLPPIALGRPTQHSEKMVLRRKPQDR